MVAFTLAAWLVALGSLPRLCLATGHPTLQFDPNTISPCLEWENNAHNLVCEEVRRYWNITALEFSRWNPSVGQNCQPWIAASYCVAPLERVPSSATTSQTTTTTKTTATTSTHTLGPSPISWTARGCYLDGVANEPVLERRISSQGGDAALTITKCKDSCYKSFFVFAGVRAGNECHCGSYVAGEWALNATECNAPCSGNRTETCGGTGRLNVFKALESEAIPTTSSRTGAIQTTTATR
ncbi:hypothetical protein S40285_09191 [Stachybotrys chlorohalonatus IBT 40285]|uniref:WSC domain-containing protein n=1 Tax=Stachybotrys chlorohalonatus (strain IBT 40285) TaxID=1283841 RepID=A0A084Q7Y5_STAC4|nr:hypothetical protein S40293_10041 [Stachybotrys chartarum IBT 40293]KFA60070.1 hypothetical protein S40285_09191 [Stachybotrys chlorohalonata IBT 40285]